MNRLHLSLCYDPIMKCLQMSIKCLLLIMRIFTSDELKGDLDHVYLSHARSNVDRYLRSMHISGSSLGRPTSIHRTRLRFPLVHMNGNFTITARVLARLLDNFD